jgi:hypothetical protein
MPKRSAPRSGHFIVANPRGIPPERHVLRVGNKRYFEGDVYDGPDDGRLVRDGFLVEVSDEQE